MCCFSIKKCVDLIVTQVIINLLEKIDVESKLARGVAVTMAIMTSDFQSLRVKTSRLILHNNSSDTPDRS